MLFRDGNSGDEFHRPQKIGVDLSKNMMMNQGMLYWLKIPAEISNDLISHRNFIMTQMFEHPVPTY